MNSNPLRFLFFVVATLIPAHCPYVLSQNLPPLPWLITSDYGPRMIDNNNHRWLWDFHKGIDYGAPSGSEIKALVGGEIKFIKYGGGWDIAVKNGENLWEYIHIFKGKDESSVILSNWELRSATLVKPETGDKKYGNVIIKWERKNAEKILNHVPDYLVRNTDGTYILGNDGKPIKTRSFVESGEVIALSGNSGPVGTPYHLHLELNDGKDNPLLYIQHPPDKIPTLIPETPYSGKVFIPEELKKNYPIKVKVDSRDGLDLEEMDLWIYKNKDPKNAIHLSRESGKPTFRYGGRRGEDKSGTLVSPEGLTRSGVEPITLGEDRFIYFQKFGELNLGKGSHLLVVKGKDINDNEIPQKHVEFRISDISTDVVISARKEYYKVDEYFGVVDEESEEYDYPVDSLGQEFTGDIYCTGYGIYQSETFPGIGYDDPGRWYEITNVYMGVEKYRIEVSSMTRWGFSLIDCKGGHGVKYQGGPYDMIDEEPSDCRIDITLDVDFRDKEEKLLGHYSGEIFSYSKRENLELWLWDKENGGYDIFGGIIPNPSFKPQEEGLKLKDTTVGDLALLGGVNKPETITNVGVTIDSYVFRTARGPDMYAKIAIKGVDFYQK